MRLISVSGIVFPDKTGKEEKANENREVHRPWQ